MIIKYFDLETTGLLKPSLSDISQQPHVYEYYCLAEDDSDLHLFIRPPIQIPDVAIPKDVARDKVKKAAVAKSLNDKVSTCPRFEEVADKIKADIEEADEIWAHNSSYDFTVLNYEFTRIGRKIEWSKVRCSLEETEWIRGYRLSLTALHELLFGEGFGNAHEADADVRALRRCVRALKEREMI